MSRLVSEDSLFETIIARTRAVTGVADGAIPLHEPQFAGREWEYVKECLDTGWVSSVGKYVELFERRLEELTGAGRAVGIVNGTAALQLCCQLAGARAGDEVLVPALTFVATANAVSHAGGVPHFVDCERRSLGIDAGRLASYLDGIAELRGGETLNRRTGRRIAALIAVHVFGHIGEMAALAEVCERFGLKLIEDAAESLGSTAGGRHAGTFAPLAALSFNGNKIVTTGAGGAILARDPELGARAKHLTTTAKLPHPWAYVHDQVGYNFRLPNLNAALGCAQLEQLPSFLSRKRALAQDYLRAFEGVAGVAILAEPSGTRGNYWLNALLLTGPGGRELRDRLLRFAHDRGVLLRPAWELMHRLPMYSSCPRMELPVAEELEASLVNLPSGSRLGRSS